MVDGDDDDDDYKSDVKEGSVTTKKKRSSISFQTQRNSHSMGLCKCKSTFSPKLPFGTKCALPVCRGKNMVCPDCLINLERLERNPDEITPKQQREVAGFLERHREQRAHQDKLKPKHVENSLTPTKRA